VADAEMELEEANRHLEVVEQNKQSYTSNVEVWKKHERRYLGIQFSPYYTTHTEAKFDEAKYAAAVAEAKLLILKREQKLAEARADFQSAQ